MIQKKILALGIALSLVACSVPNANKDMENLASPLNYLALGDSYTIGESVAEKERWPLQLTDRLNRDGVEMKSPKIIATTGWRTDQLKAAIATDEELLETYDLVSLLIGVNNQFQGKSVESFAPEFEDLLKKAIQLTGSDVSKVFVVSIPDYGKTPFGSGNAEAIGKALDAYNAVSREICDKYNVKYFNITPISRQDDPNGELIAEDNLHPSGRQYQLWVDSFYQEVLQMVKQ